VHICCKRQLNHEMTMRIATLEYEIPRYKFPLLGYDLAPPSRGCNCSYKSWAMRNLYREHAHTHSLCNSLCQPCVCDCLCPRFLPMRHYNFRKLPLSPTTAVPPFWGPLSGARPWLWRSAAVANGFQRPPKPHKNITITREGWLGGEDPCRYFVDKFKWAHVARRTWSAQC